MKMNQKTEVIFMWMLFRTEIAFDTEPKGNSEMASDFFMFPGGGDVLLISSLSLHLMSHVDEYSL